MTIFWNKFNEIVSFLWGAPLSLLMIGFGLYATIKTGFFQIKGIKLWWKKTVGELFSKSNNDDFEGQLTQRQTISTALAGTIGSGNIAGVSSAIAIGGPGAVFWMWVIAIVGMITKMCEVTLSVAFREKGVDGEYYGGPMYYMKKNIKKIGSILAFIYALAFLLDILIDIGLAQTNTLATCINDVFNIPTIVIGIALLLISVLIISFGGVNRIGKVCGKFVPLMIIVYIFACVGVIVFNIEKVPEAFSMIVKYAFAPAPAVGGFVGSTVSLTIGKGSSRGIYSNEAGIGVTGSIHAIAKTDDPVHQGMFGIFEVFIDTIIICTLTALTVICSGVWSNGSTGIVLTFDGFRTVWGNFGAVILCIAVFLFCYSSYLGGYIEYRTVVSYIFGDKAVKYMRVIYFLIPIAAILLEVEQVWSLVDLTIGFLIIPNMIALIILCPVFFKLFRSYIDKCKHESE